MELDAQQKKELVENLIFDGYATKEFTYGTENKPIIFKLRTLTQKEQEDSFARINQYEDNVAKTLELKLSVLSYALIAVNGILVSQEAAFDIVHKLPPRILNALYDDYDALYAEQKNIIDDENILKNIVKDNFNRVRYKVMRAVNALPTEQRVKDMSDIQFLWYYLNLIEDIKEQNEDDKSKLDYLTWFINPEMAKSIHDKGNTTKNQFGRTTRDVKSGNTITTYTDGIVNDDFERELAEALGNEPLTDIGSSTQKGDSYESQDDFLSRAAMFKQQLDKQQAQNEQQKHKEKEEELTKIENEAKKAGIDPTNVDFFDFDE